MSSGDQGENQKQAFPATVVQIRGDDFYVVINRGTQDSVYNGQRLLLYELSEEEITDPTSGESLGRLEIPKGTGEVEHAQERMALVISDRFKPPKSTIIKRQDPFAFGRGTEEEIIPSNQRRPFTSPKVGDLMKPV